MPNAVKILKQNNSNIRSYNFEFILYQSNHEYYDDVV
jgi:hypothetical protein